MSVSTMLIIGAAALGVSILAQFLFPGLVSGIFTGLSYGSVKALLDTWTANRKERKAERQKRRAERQGLFGRRRRQQSEPTPEPTPSPTPAPPAPKVDQSKLSDILGSDTAEPVDVQHGQIEGRPALYFPNGRARRDARRERRNNRRR